ncbi:MAG: winged helix-turn-helix domain-containing protein [Acidobacteriota bacterium]
MRFGPFELNRESGQLLRRGRALHLPPQPTRVLDLLVGRPGELVRREELRDLLWPRNHHVDRDQGLNTCIRQLRRCLGDDAKSPRFIATVPRRGYRFVAGIDTGPVQAEDPITVKPTEGTEEPGAPSDDPGDRRWRSHRIVACGSMLLMSIATGLAMWLLVATGSTPAPAQSAAPNLVAVLPFDAEADDEGLEDLADRATDLLTERIRTVHGFPSMRLPRAPPESRWLTVQQARDHYGAPWVLLGEVRYQSGDVSIAVELVETQSSDTLWAAQQHIPPHKTQSSGIPWRQEFEASLGRALARHSPETPP